MECLESSISSKVRTSLRRFEVSRLQLETKRNIQAITRTSVKNEENLFHSE